MPCLPKATDLMLAQCGLYEAPANGRASAILRPLECGLSGDHRWVPLTGRLAKQAPKDSDPIETCITCGSIRRLQPKETL